MHYENGQWNSHFSWCIPKHACIHQIQTPTQTQICIYPLSTVHRSIYVHTWTNPHTWRETEGSVCLLILLRGNAVMFIPASPIFWLFILLHSISHVPLFTVFLSSISSPMFLLHLHSSHSTFITYDLYVIILIVTIHHIPWQHQEPWKTVNRESYILSLCVIYQHVLLDAKCYFIPPSFVLSFLSFCVCLPLSMLSLFHSNLFAYYVLYSLSPCFHSVPFVGLNCILVIRTIAKLSSIRAQTCIHSRAANNSGSLFNSYKYFPNI